MRAFGLMHDRSEELALLICLENGKSLADARSEVAYAAEFFRWYAEEGVRLRGQVGRSPSGANRLLVTYQPVGVSVLITPWNFPAAMATRKIAPALAAGCTAVLKPAAETPLTALAVAAILQEAGLPAGVLNVVTTSDPGPVVEALLTDRRTRMLSFTGSTEVGRLLLRTAADNVLKCGMELGGMPLRRPGRRRRRGGARGRHGRQDAQRWPGVHSGEPASCRRPSTTRSSRASCHGWPRCGSVLATTRALIAVPSSTRRPSARWTSSCGTRSTGARRVLLGGQPVDGQGCSDPPTVLVDVPLDARVLHEEVFGPVAPVVRFEQEEEVLAMVNRTEFGLVSYLYTGDLARGLRLAERIESGMVGLNRGLVSDPAAPFGGTKQSGIGREGSTEGLLEFMETQYVATSW